MRFRAVLIDIDNTLFHFNESSYKALKKAFGEYGVDFTRAMFAEYEALNDQYWKAFERGEIPRERLFYERFDVYFARIGLRADGKEFDHRYRVYLSEGYDLMPHAEALLQALQGKYKVFVVTNGDAMTQDARIAGAGLEKYFDGVFVSERVGYQKPDKAFFDAVFAAIGEEYRSCSLLVGDSLSSDMQGGRNAGIPTCFYGPRKQADDRCDYVVGDLLDILPILEKG